MNREMASVGQVIWQWSVIIALVLLNGFFVAAEFALVKVRSSQLDAEEDQGNAKVRAARHATQHLDAYLSATQLGITLASLGLGYVGEPYLARMVQPVLFEMGVRSDTVIRYVSFGIAFSTITFLHIVFGELAPKSLAIRRSLGTSMWTAAPLGWFYAIFRPAITLLNGVANKFLVHVCKIEPVGEHEMAHSEEELRVILAESERADAVTPLGKEILLNALDMQKRVARDITTPRGDVIFLDTEHTFEENLKLAMESRHTRFPLCREHLDNAIGLVHIKDLLKLTRDADAKMEDIKREMMTVPEMMSLEKLLNTFLSKHAHLALVVDEFGGAVGVVTLDNVLEELVGDIQDEFDSEKPELHQVNKDEFVVQGSLALHELNDMIDLKIESEEVTTVGGYVTQLLGHLPRVGEKTKIEHFDVSVTKADGRRVVEVLFKRVVS